MSEFLAPLNYGRARDVLRRLSAYSSYTPQGAAEVLDVLRENYPLVFKKLESKQFDNGAVLMEMPGANSTAPLVFVSHLDAPQANGIVESSPHEMPMNVPLSRAHVVALLEALEGLLNDGYQPGGDLLLALSMDGLSGGAGARSIAAHLKARSLSPCFVLDHGGYATMEAFRTYLPKNAPLALIGICEKGEIQGEMTADREVNSRPGRERARPVDELLRAGARFTRRPRRARLCTASEIMLSELGKKAPLLQRWLVRRPRLTFPLMRILWRNRSVFHQFFVSERTVCALNAQGTLQTPAQQAALTFRQTLIPGVRAAEARHRIRCLTGNDDLHLTFSMCEDASVPSDPSGEAWEALETAIEIQFERAVMVPCLSPFVTDGRFYAQPGGRVYRFSPFMLTGEEALSGTCTVTDGTLQTAVQFFRSMLCV
ncbi:MAG: hypothetical protein SOV75_02250 [Candidatus Limiplasma sp.]|nr:hypothetical protein [Candidatus Limiplasma sp.]